LDGNGKQLEPNKQLVYLPKKKLLKPRSWKILRL
jgi:hypothetical protein